MMKMVVLTLPIFLSIASCKERNDSLLKEYYANNKLKSETFYFDKVHKRKVNYYENGTIQSIFNFKNDQLTGEQLWFHENGVLDQKVLYRKGQRNGNAYFFYPSGTLKNSRYFKNGKEVLFGADYWDDSLNLIKSSLHFNDNGEIYYKKNFDSNGNFISEEGQAQ